MSTLTTVFIYNKNFILKNLYYSANMYNFLWLKKAKSYALIIIRLEDFINENMFLMLNS